MSELCLRSFNSINSCWWWTSNRKVWCLLLFFDGKPDRIYLSCRLSLAVQRSLALPKLKTHKGLKEVSGGGETCLRCPLFLPGHQTEAFAAGVQEPPRATVQFYFSCIVHSSCKRKPSSSASCFQKGYFTNMGLATEVHLPNAAVWLLRFITSYQTSCRTDHLFVNCHLDGLYWPVIFFFSQVSTQSPYPYPAPAALDWVFPLLVLLLCLSLWKVWAPSSSFCHFSGREFSFLFLGEQWSSAVALNVQISWYKHCRRKNKGRHIHTVLEVIPLYLLSISFLQENTFILIFQLYQI